MTKSTAEGKSKLKRVLKFLKHKINDKRVMGTNNLSQLYTWVNVAYGVYPNLKSHTGGGMSFGYRLVHYKSSKQKLNTKSSTEAELV